VRVFITGGSGYIGRPTIRELRRRGHEVTALVRSANAAQTVKSLGATPVLGELSDVDALREAARNADGAIHLAMARGLQVAEIDCIAASAIQDGLNGGPYIHTSGTWVYGNTRGLVNEDAPANPPGVIAWRLANEKTVLGRGADGGHPVIVMPGLVYGCGEGLIQRCFIDPARSRGKLHYIGDGTNHWSLVHVDDIAELYVLALAAAPGTILAGVGEYSLTVADVLPALSIAAGCPGHFRSLTLDDARTELGPIAEAFALDQQVSSARAQAQLGWEPPPRDVLSELAGRGLEASGSASGGVQSRRLAARW
jgi:nucleoside-diphosphate-sugar epimerase